MGTVRIYCTEQVALFLVHALGLGGKLLLAALFGIPMRPQAGRIEGENSGAVRSDDHDGHWAQHPASEEETETASEGAEFVFGWGTDYTHYFIGFVLLYVCAACCGGCLGLCVIWEINASISVCLSLLPPVSLFFSLCVLWLKAVVIFWSRYTRYKTLASSGTTTVMGTPPAPTPRQQLPEHETHAGVRADARP